MMRKAALLSAVLLALILAGCQTTKPDCRVWTSGVGELVECN